MVCVLKNQPAEAETHRDLERIARTALVAGQAWIEVCKHPVAFEPQMPADRRAGNHSAANTTAFAVLAEVLTAGSRISGRAAPRLRVRPRRPLLFKAPRGGGVSVVFTK